MKRERRRIGEIRASTGDKPGVTLHAIKPGVVDDFGSLWMPDSFDASLAQRLPTLCWSHDWSEPLGPALGYRTGADGPEVDFAFSDFEAVPQARRAHAQVMDGTIADCSVGFSDTKRRDPTEEEVRLFPGVREIITSATLDEVSLVLRGAVPGAKVLSVRSGERVAMVDIDTAVELAKRINAGEMTVAEGKAALQLVAEEGPEDEPPEGEPIPEEPPPDDLEELEGEMDDALGLVASLNGIGRSRH